MECDGCTLCCKVLEIPEVNSKFNEWCKYCDKERGCKIYSERPDSCKEFNCAWVQMKKAGIKVGIEIRPDICGVVFEKYTDNVMMALTSGKILERVWGQIKFFNNEGISVVLFDHSNKSKTVYLSKGHTREFVEKEINDSRKLYRRSD
jgi:hypothetical protein